MVPDDVFVPKTTSAKGGKGKGEGWLSLHRTEHAIPTNFTLSVLGLVLLGEPDK